MNQITMDRCINCGIATNRCNTIGRNFLDDEATLFVIRKWRPSELVRIQPIYLYLQIPTSTQFFVQLIKVLLNV